VTPVGDSSLGFKGLEIVNESCVSEQNTPDGRMKLQCESNLQPVQTLFTRGASKLRALTVQVTLDASKQLHAEEPSFS
jgi:hypothetical protein